MTQDTSAEALALAPDRTQSVLNVIALRGPYGATDWEIHLALACPYTAVQRPRGELVKSGQIVKTEARRLTGWGRKAIVWQAV